jgi:hypothetical protein
VWVDGVKQRDPVKLKYLATCCQAAYEGNLANVIGADASELTVRLNPPLPKTWTFRKQDSVLMLIQGTTYGSEYVYQTDGWLNPVPVPGGVANSYYHGVGQAAYIASPNNVDLCFGHSLGGAAADAAAAFYRAGGRPQTFAASFGAPRVWSQGSTPINGGGVHTFFALDPVPLQPYDGFGGFNWRLGSDNYMALPTALELVSPQGASNIGAIATILNTYGSSWHAISNYVQYFGNMSLPVVPHEFEGVIGMAEVYEVTVKGVYMGQACDNGFHVIPVGENPDPENVFDDMRGFWRRVILPRVSDGYQVLTYQTRRISSMIWKNDANHNLGSLYRHDNHVRKGGQNTDWGRRTGDAMPSMLAYGFAKTAGAYYYPDLAAVVPNAKPPKGNIRFGGVMRSDINVATNQLTAAAVTSWTTVGLEMALPEENGRRYIQCVVTNQNGGTRIGNPPVWQPNYIIDPNDAALPGFGVGRLSSMSLNSFVTSQISRKQTPARLG